MQNYRITRPAHTPTHIYIYYISTQADWAYGFMALSYINICGYVCNVCPSIDVSTSFAFQYIHTHTYTSASVYIYCIVVLFVKFISLQLSKSI